MSRIVRDFSKTSSFYVQGGGLAWDFVGRKTYNWELRFIVNKHQKQNKQEIVNLKSEKQRNCVKLISCYIQVVPNFTKNIMVRDFQQISPFFVWSAEWKTKSAILFLQCDICHSRKWLMCLKFSCAECRLSHHQMWAWRREEKRACWAQPSLWTQQLEPELLKLLLNN